MLKYGNRDFRNLQEQVYANMKNIQDIINGSNIIADFKTVNVIGQVDSFSDLPDADTYDGNWGDAFLVGDEEDSKLYVFTKAYEEENAPQWFDVGHFPIPGPTGPQGEQGPIGEPGTDWYLGTAIVHQQGQGTIITSYATTYPNLKVDDFYLIKSTYTSGLVTFKAGDVYQVTGIVGTTAYVVKRLSIQGPQGETGATGATGADGSMWYTGVYSAINYDMSNKYHYLQVASYPNIKAGDYFLATSSGTVLPTKSITAGDCFIITAVSADTGRATINSTAVGNIRGPQGPTGASGGLWYSGTSGITYSNAQYIIYSVGLTNLKIGDLYLVTSTYQSGGITINAGDVFKVSSQSTTISFVCTKLANIQGPQGPAGEIDAENLTECLIGDSGINLEYDEEEDKVYASVKYAAPLDLDSNDNLTINLASSLKVDDSDQLAVNPYRVFTPIVFSSLIGTDLKYTSLIYAGNFMSIPLVYQQTVGTTVTSVALIPRTYELNVNAGTSTIKAEGYDSSNNKYSLSWEFIGSGIYNITVTTP